MTNPLTGDFRSTEAPTWGALTRAKILFRPARFLPLIALVIASSAMASDGLPNPVLDPEGIRFPLVEEAGRLALTVSGPEGFHVRREFAGDAPALSLVGPEGALPVDGTYVWELRSLEGTRAAIGSGAFPRGCRPPVDALGSRDGGGHFERASWAIPRYAHRGCDH